MNAVNVCLCVTVPSARVYMQFLSGCFCEGTSVRAYGCLKGLAPGATVPFRVLCASVWDTGAEAGGGTVDIGKTM